MHWSCFLEIIMKTVVIIPVYNEEKKIYSVVHGVKAIGYDVVVVDDFSSDQSAEQAQKARAKVLRHFINRGYGAALETGNQYALQAGYDIVVHFDGDGQHNPNEIEKLVDKIRRNEAEVVIGSRFLDCLDRDNNTNLPAKNEVPLVRKFLIKIAILFTWMFSGVKLTDAHNGFRAFCASALGKIQCRQDGMSYSSEIIDQIAYLNLRVSEVRVTVVYTDYSKSKGEGNIKKMAVGAKFLWGKIIK